MATGKVKWFNPQKRFGFIEPDAGGADIFVHITALEKAGLLTLREGQPVSYDVTEHNGKLSAANIKLL